MSKLKEALEAGQFPIVMELKPPKGVDPEGLLAPVKSVNGKVTAYGIPDNEHAKMKLSALAAARLVQEAGGEPLLLMTCRDRNRLALESDLLGAGALGLENILALSGDFVSLGDHPDAKPVYDADSVQLLQIARGLMAGHDSAGLALEGNPNFCLGAVLIPEADPAGPQLLKAKKKLKAGAEFFITAPVFDLEKLRQFRQALGSQDLKLMVCLKAPKPAEVEQAARGEHRKVYSLPPEVVKQLAADDQEEVLKKGAALAGRLLKEIKGQKLADGVYVKARGRGDLMALVLETAGV
ncbi:MAG: methylenetetrahydrofolate reductase [Deltaproteobacteria bacterium]|nr:methylenetetrahydrofolate reductase [Deltaproteobacteria bacterium]